MNKLGDDRNPCYPYALRACDIKSGVRFIIIDLCNLSTKKGMFLGEPRIQTIARQKSWCADCRLSGQDDEIFLSGNGIIKQPRQLEDWNDQRFVILGNQKGRKQYQEWYDNGGKELLEPYTRRAIQSRARFGAIGRRAGPIH